MTLFKAQRIIKNIRFKLSMPNVGLDMLDEKIALDMADKIIEDELIKERGCGYCNTKRIESMIGYKYIKFCPRCGRKIER